MLEAYPGYPRRRALETIGADAMFVAPTWAFADAYSAYAPTYVYRFDHTPTTLRATGLGAVHDSEIVHILYTYGSHVGRRLHPLGTWWTPGVGRQMRPDLAGVRRRGGRCPVVVERLADARRRTTRIIRSVIDAIVDDPDGPRRSAWQEVS